MVKFLLTDSLVQRVSRTFNLLDQASIDSIPSKTRLVFEKLSLRSTRETDDGSEELELIEGHRWIDHSSLCELSAAAQHHSNSSKTAETCPGANSLSVDLFLSVILLLGLSKSDRTD
ncbi:hypothetical protein PtA15_4A249 [Puccinia triticina]|uniref:Uncharacterized protein n=1 Tax=Puccinia triticina TaxID=208348 RepID=A0ABY7CFD2_9BASI|nr:uncharacterized protein PtA15_4A249 [Puccinia triticina]WAQ83800.1 hypothetical protein PtA15_4A249 [Puccinia triticina]WAR54642.1 hypothetical protein PtB15_4B259 [Puccinia triticina]